MVGTAMGVEGGPTGVGCEAGMTMSEIHGRLRVVPLS
jgi:hypothetical protein